ncbi:MAG: hypothetical protein WCF65_09620 [Parachlamydiaceae bacterium]
MDHKNTREELAFPVPVIPKMGALEKPRENPNVIKSIIRGAIQGAYQLKTPSEPSSYSPDYGKEQAPLISEEQIQIVTHLIESLQPTDAIEAALASQFVITYIRGLKTAQGSYPVDLNSTIQLFEFGHQVLETLTKYRIKGAQLINVQYNHNQGQINNIKVVEQVNREETIEVKNEL